MAQILELQKKELTMIPPPIFLANLQVELEQVGVAEGQGPEQLEEELVEEPMVVKVQAGYFEVLGAVYF